MKYDYGQSFYYAKHRKSKRKKLILGIIGACLICVVIFSIIFMPGSRVEDELISGAITDTITPMNSQNPTKTPIFDQELIQIINDEVGKSKAEYGIVLTDFENKKSYRLNADQTFTAASLYKLWVMATLMEQIDTKKISKKTILESDIDSLYERFNIASPSANAKITISVVNALEQMITVSDNTTALLLSSRVGMANIKTFLEKNNMTNSTLGTVDSEPSTTPNDIARFFKLLYDKKLTGSSEMLDILKRQKLNGKIPKYFPEGTIVAHKTGELFEFSHDAGIVYHPNGDYMIVIMTKSKESMRQEIDDEIANLSEKIYNYISEDRTNNSSI